MMLLWLIVDRSPSSISDNIYEDILFVIILLFGGAGAVYCCVKLRLIDRLADYLAKQEETGVMSEVSFKNETEVIPEVSFKNPRSGELRNVKVGWSWTLFLFSGFLGLPLFWRKLNIWGAVFLALWIVQLFTPLLMGFLILPIGLGLDIWIGMKGNELTAKNYLDLGWEFVDPESDSVKYARSKWGLLT